eukprot:g562.t1
MASGGTTRIGGGDKLEHFDVIVLGTGITESILAGALCRVGRNVLHLDENGHYGADFATFTLREAIEWGKCQRADPAGTPSVAGVGADDPPCLDMGAVAKSLDEAEAAVCALLRAQHPACSGRRMFRTGDSVAAMFDPDAVEAPFDPEVSSPVFWGYKACDQTALRPAECVHMLAAGGGHGSSGGGKGAPCGRRAALRSITPTDATDAAANAAEAAAAAAAAARRAAAARPRAPQGAPGTLPNSAVLRRHAMALEAARVAADDAAAAQARAEARCRALTPAQACGPLVHIMSPQTSRRFCIDLAPRLVMCAGQQVDALVSSGVGRYLEFQSVEKVCVCDEVVDAGSAAPKLRVWGVPCTKGDIFQDRKLSVLEKRQLMKFMQFCYDRLTQQLGGDGAVVSKNENDAALRRGRSLSRPQNKAAVQHDTAGFEERPFSQFLAHCKLSPKLQQVMLSAVALVPAADGCMADGTALNTLDGLNAVTRYLAATGKFGKTAFLCPVYGTCELPQAYCRLAAVYGGVYVLRNAVRGLLVAGTGTGTSTGTGGGAGAGVGAGAEDGDEGKGDASASASPSVEDCGTVCRGVVTEAGEALGCRALVASPRYLPREWGRAAECGAEAEAESKVLLRRVCVTRKPLSEGCGRVFAVVPPNTPGVHNRYAVHVLQLDYAACVAAHDHFVLHLTTLVDAGNDAARDKVLLRVQSMLFPRGPQDCGDGGSGQACGGDVLWHLEFEQRCAGEAVARRARGGAPDNVFVTPDAHSNPMPLHTEQCVDTAKELFGQICPGEPFLPKAASAVAADCEDDTEDAALSAALQASEDAPVGAHAASGGELQAHAPAPAPALAQAPARTVQADAAAQPAEPQRPAKLFRIASASEWSEAQQRGRYSGNDLDLSSGFLHLSTAAQVPLTLARFFSGREDLVLLALGGGAAFAAHGTELRWEAADGDVFPHLYPAAATDGAGDGPASFPVSTVQQADPLRWDVASGQHQLPDEL